MGEVEEGGEWGKWRVGWGGEWGKWRRVGWGEMGMREVWVDA